MIYGIDSGSSVTINVIAYWDSTQKFNKLEMSVGMM